MRVPCTATTTTQTIVTTTTVFGCAVPLLRPPSNGVGVQLCISASRPLLSGISGFQKCSPTTAGVDTPLRFSAEAEGIEKAQGNPVRTECKQHRRAYTKPTTGIKPVCGLWCFQPSPEQLTNFGNHRAHMAILSIVEPAPMMNQTQIQAQFVQMGIGCPQMFVARCPGLTECIE